MKDTIIYIPVLSNFEWFLLGGIVYKITFTYFYTEVKKMKDLMTVVLFSVIGLVAFVAYLLYAAKLLFFVALVYLTYSFVRHGFEQGDLQHPPSLHMDDAGLPAI